MRAEIKRLHQELQTTVIYVTHDQMEAMTMADRIAVMSGGVVSQMGTPDEIYSRPANVYVAGFVGSPAMNFLNGQVTSDGGATVVRGDGWALPLSADNARRAQASTDGHVIVGARHGHVRIVPDANGTGLPGRLYTVEPTGDVTFVHFYLGEALLVASTTESFHGRPDQPVRVEFDQQHLYLFDQATQQAL
jgi:multiple sugar transport system ATP-binding protein